MKIKTSELTGHALDWAVGEASGTPIYRSGKTLTRMDMDGNVYWRPSTDWAQGGPIIEREEIGIKRNAPCSAGREWEASPSVTAKGAGGKWGYGSTPLEAAMRCYVASKLGDEIDVPDELMTVERG
jgi:hypothetical protein